MAHHSKKPHRSAGGASSCPGTASCSGRLLRRLQVGDRPRVGGVRADQHQLELPDRRRDGDLSIGAAEQAVLRAALWGSGPARIDRMPGQARPSRQPRRRGSGSVLSAALLVPPPTAMPAGPSVHSKQPDHEIRDEDQHRAEPTARPQTGYDESAPAVPSGSGRASSSAPRPANRATDLGTH